MNHDVRSQLERIRPLDPMEEAHLADAMAWVDSGAQLYRIAKPATPPKHLVSYFVVIDGSHILLVDHKNAQRWLPPGGHVEPDENPRHTVVREIKEELGLTISLEEIIGPLMVTVAETVGLTYGHTDVSLWYVVRANQHESVAFDETEFHEVRWFSFAEVPLGQSDPHLGRFLEKLHATEV